MKIFSLKKTLMAASLLAAVGVANQSFAHEQGGTLDNAGNNSKATDYYLVYCYDDGTGPTSFLYLQVQDFSNAVPGLLLSAQGTKVISATQTIMSNAAGGNATSIYGGDGPYYVTVDKTKAGYRSYNLIYHCMTGDNPPQHTGTSINMLQDQ
jgi:hypothetical protein